MPPPILILESRREVADALQGVLSSVNYDAIVRQHVERLSDLGPRPGAIIVRVAFEGVTPTHAAVARLPADRPPIIAIVFADDEMHEARRLKCDVVLRAPGDLSQLQDVLTRLVPLAPP
jgi:hypothetical protein